MPFLHRHLKTGKRREVTVTLQRVEREPSLLLSRYGLQSLHCSKLSTSISEETPECITPSIDTLNACFRFLTFKLLLRLDHLDRQYCDLISDL